MGDRLIFHRAAAHRVVLYAATLLLYAQVTQAQTGPPTAGAAVAVDSLLATIAALDDRYFDAYNRCDLEVLEGLHTDDLEAYHDLAGGPVGWATVREGLEQGACVEPGRIRRELVPGTLSAYPIPGYGAIQFADHLFYEVQENGEERPVTAARLIVLWRRVDGDWKVARMISYDHQPAG